MRIDLIAGARPNIVKVAPLYHALRAAGGFRVRLVHTGQHYDASMSDVFFQQLGALVHREEDRVLRRAEDGGGSSRLFA